MAVKVRYVDDAIIEERRHFSKIHGTNCDILKRSSCSHQNWVEKVNAATCRVWTDRQTDRMTRPHQATTVPLALA